MSELKAAKAEIIELLSESGIEAYDYLPERINPPLVVTLPGSPYLEWNGEDIPFGHFRVNFTLALIIGGGDNESVTDRMNVFIEETLKVLLAANWTIDNVNAFGAYQQNGIVYLATDIQINDIRKFEV